MKEFYDFSKGRKNPYAERIRKEGYSVTIYYSPEDIANRGGKEYEMEPEELKAFEAYQKLNPAAQELGLLSAAKAGKEAMAKNGRKGGRKRAQTLSPERRKEIARKAVQARWAKKTAEKPDGLSESGEPAKKEAATG